MNYFKRIKGEKKMKREIEERNSRVSRRHDLDAHQRSNQQQKKQKKKKMVMISSE